MYPNAKFIYIHRNPVEVFLSTQNFYRKMMPHLQLQSITNDEIDKMILEVYKLIVGDYLEQKQKIPKGNLVEVAFSELEMKPTEILKKIYIQLDLPNFESAISSFECYLGTMKNYKKNKHSIDRKDFEKVRENWDFAFKEWSYNTPETINILDEKDL